MKKLVFVLMAVIAMTGCSVDSGYESIQYELAEITNSDLPGEFVLGETYDVTVTYQLATDCYTFTGLDPRRAGTSSEDRREIYVSAISAIKSSTLCDPNAEGASGTSKFSILIDEMDEYNFHFWTGEDAVGNAIYYDVTVPVTEAPTTEE